MIRHYCWLFDDGNHAVGGLLHAPIYEAGVRTKQVEVGNNESWSASSGMYRSFDGFTLIFL